MNPIQTREPELGSLRDGGRWHYAARTSKFGCSSNRTNRLIAGVSLVATGLGLAACSTHGVGGSSSGAPSTNRPAESVSAAPADPAGRDSAGDQPSPTGTAQCATENAWGTGARAGGSDMSPAPLYLARAGRHECYDRVVFDLNGPDAVGFSAGYVPLVSADGTGAPVPVRGQAALEVIVRAPIYGTDNQGHQPRRQPPALGADFVAPDEVAGWASLTEVKFAGSFEGQTTFAVGVRDRRPFRVWVDSEQNYRHVVLDIAHGDAL